MSKTWIDTSGQKWYTADNGTTIKVTKSMDRQKEYYQNVYKPVKADTRNISLKQKLIENAKWNRLAKQPGTPEFMEQRNRISSTDTIRIAQYQSDLITYIDKKMGSSTDTTKRRALADEFRSTYATMYKVQSFSPVRLTDISHTLNSLTTETIGKITLGNINQLKDQLLTDVSGQIFQIGKKKLGDLTSIGRPNMLDVSGYIGGNELASKIYDVQTVTKTINNIVAGQITSVTQITNLERFMPSGNFADFGMSIKTMASDLGGAIKRFFKW
jgi:hypothetical protein